MITLLLRRRLGIVWFGPSRCSPQGRSDCCKFDPQKAHSHVARQSHPSRSVLCAFEETCCRSNALRPTHHHHHRSNWADIQQSTKHQNITDIGNHCATFLPFHSPLRRNCCATCLRHASWQGLMISYPSECAKKPVICTAMRPAQH